MKNSKSELSVLRENDLAPWEYLMKQIVWLQMGEAVDKKILDFGSGRGITADHFAQNNEVIAVEPSREDMDKRWHNNEYTEICGSIESLKSFPNEYFDIIICHNVLEYAEEREDIIKEFTRLLKSEGYLSLVKHNRPGRVMQMVVLLNDFEKAESLLDGNDGCTSKFGDIHYYEDEDILKWSEKLVISKKMGMRTFFDLQQNQESQRDVAWQKKMIEIEMRVSEMEEYQRIAFFHHLIIKKTK